MFLSTPRPRLRSPIFFDFIFSMTRISRRVSHLFLAATVAVVLTATIFSPMPITINAAENLPPLAPISATESFADDSALADDRPIAPERDFSRESRPVFGEKKSAATSARSAESARNQSAENPPAGTSRKNPVSMALTVIVMVAAIVAIFAFIIYKHFWLRGKRLFSAPVLEILARTQVDAKKYFALLRVGKRLLVVGVSSDGFSALTEITDPQEVAELMTEARPKTPSGKNAFFELFKSHVADATTPLPEGGFDDVQARVKDLRRQENGGKQTRN